MVDQPIDRKARRDTGTRVRVARVMWAGRNIWTWNDGCCRRIRHHLSKSFKSMNVICYSHFPGLFRLEVFCVLVNCSASFQPLWTHSYSYLPYRYFSPFHPESVACGAGTLKFKVAFKQIHSEISSKLSCAMTKQNMR